MPRKLFILTALSGLIAVVIGAFGAHALVDKIPAASLASYKTGVSYQFYHTLAAMLSLMIFLHQPSKYFLRAAVCFLVGVLLFSGSIYLLATRSMTGISFTNILGPMTPIGGLFFMIGWLMLIMGTFNGDISTKHLAQEDYL